jgi:hypothetical protein
VKKNLAAAVVQLAGWVFIWHITPCAQKGTKKTYEIFFIAFELSIVLCSPCGAGRDMIGWFSTACCLYGARSKSEPRA